jgi:hypothetical protein
MALTRILLDIEMEDGTTHENIKTNIADQMLYGKKAKIEKWGNIAEDPVTAMIFLGWAALHRLGLYDKGFNEFVNEAAAVQPSNANEEDLTIHPTTAAR